MIIVFTNKESHVRKMTCVLQFFVSAAEANDDWARKPKHADVDEYRERVARHD